MLVLYRLTAAVISLFCVMRAPRAAVAWWRGRGGGRGWEYGDLSTTCFEPAISDRT